MTARRRCSECRGSPGMLRAMAQASFPATRWTLVLASRSSPEARRKALEELLSIYWRPLYVFARHCGSSHDEAQDAVQGLCAQLVSSEFLAHLDPERRRAMLPPDPVSFSA